MTAILIPVKSGEKISFLIAIELGLVFIIATLDTNMVPAGRGFKPGFDIMIFTTKFCCARFSRKNYLGGQEIVHDHTKKNRLDFEPWFKLPFICWVVLINHITLLQTFLFILFFQDMIFHFWTRAIRPYKSNSGPKMISNHWKRLNRNKAPPSIFQKWLIKNQTEPVLSPENHLNSETDIKMLAPKISNKEKWSRIELRAETIISSFQSIQVVVVQAIYLGKFLKPKEKMEFSSNDHDKNWWWIDRNIHAENPEICSLQKWNFLWPFSWRINWNIKRLTTVT